MTISWGPWEYNGGNGMRVGLEVTNTSVSHTSTSVQYTVKVYTQNQYRYNNPSGPLITYSGSFSGTKSFSNTSDGGITVYRDSKPYTYNYGGSSYGSSPGTLTFTVGLSGLYNNVTPSQSVTVTIPARPYAAPAAVTNQAVSRSSDTSLVITWSNHATAGEPYDDIEHCRWENIANSWDSWSGGGTTGTSTSWTFASVANRRYLFRIRPKNSAGVASIAETQAIQTTPAAPSNCKVSASSVSSVVISWTNGANTTNGYTYTTRIEEQVNGGAWTEVGYAGQGATSYARSGLSAGAVYAYRVRARSTIGATTNSSYSTSSTIQLQDAPAAPTVVSTVRVSDYSFTLNWTNNPSSDSKAPYESLTLQRYDNVSKIWADIATLGPTITTFGDTTTTLDRAYQWRIRANNAAGSSAWVSFTSYQTQPAAPSGVKVKAVAGGGLSVTWVNETSLTSYTIGLRYYKDGVLVTDTISLPAGQTQYTLAGVTLTSTYKFGVRAVSTVGYTSQSIWVDSPNTAASTVPNAPTSLAPSGIVQDSNLPITFSWTHNPSEDGSDQTQWQIQHRKVGAATWTLGTQKAGSSSTQAVDLSAPYTNGEEIEWQVRTWGVNATASPWSATAAFRTSTKPTVTVISPASTRLDRSKLTVSWSYSDVESTPQAHWYVELLDDNNRRLEQAQADGGATSVDLTTVIVNGSSYTLRLQVQDGDGLYSDWVEMALTAQFVPPAVPDMSVDYSQDSGTTVITLTPTPDDGGVTTMPALDATVQRRLLDPDTGEWGEWETIAEKVPTDTTLVDTVAPIANDGQYRTLATSAAPSQAASAPVVPSSAEDRWVYLSGGPRFDRVCRLMGNVAIRSTQTHENSLYTFAGRDKPTLFAGEASGRVIEVAGLLDSESSAPAEWEALIRRGGVLLFRDPLGHRMFGSVSQTAIDYLGNNLYSIAFTVTEVAYP